MPKGSEDTPHKGSCAPCPPQCDPRQPELEPPWVPPAKEQAQHGQPREGATRPHRGLGLRAQAQKGLCGTTLSKKQTPKAMRLLPGQGDECVLKVTMAVEAQLRGDTKAGGHAPVGEPLQWASCGCCLQRGQGRGSSSWCWRWKGLLPAAGAQGHLVQHAPGAQRPHRPGAEGLARG